MIVGGKLSGLNRARTLSLSYVRSYSIVGCGLLLLSTFIFGEVAVVLICAHLLTLTAVLPAAIAAHFFAWRVFRFRRCFEPWRARAAGRLAVPLVWGGVFLSGGELRPPDFVRHLGAWGIVVYYGSVLIFFSNLSLLIVWLLPSRKP